MIEILGEKIYSNTQQQQQKKIDLKKKKANMMFSLHGNLKL